MPKINMPPTFKCLNCNKTVSMYTKKGRRKDNPMFCGYQCCGDYKSAMSVVVRLETIDHVSNMKSFKKWYKRSLGEWFCFGEKYRLQPLDK